MKTSILSPSGRLFVVGLVAMTVLAARLQAQYVSTIVSNGLNEPYGVTADPNENVYFTDSVNNRVAMYVPSTKVVTTLAGQPTAGTNNGTGANVKFSAPLGIVYARGGLVVVDQANQQLRYVSLAGAVSNLAGVTGVVGTNNGAALGSAQFSYPTGIAVANDGVTLYIADTGNNSIRVLNSNNVVSTLATSYLYNGTSHLFHSPAAVALDNNNNVWIADSYNQVICEVTNGTTQAYGIAGTYRVSGTNDSATASTAQFNLPSGLLWDPNLGILVISDSDNATIRSLTNSSSGYAVQTLAGLAGVPGDVDGPLSTAELRHPVGLSIDVVDTGYYFADWGNNALRVLQPTQPPPAPVAIANPALGYVIYAGATEDAQFVPFTQPVSVFNNAVNLSVEQNDGTVETYVTYGATGTTIPAPTTNSIYEKAFVYQINEGEPPPVPLLTGVGILPAMTIKAISIAPGRPSSQAVSAEIDFITANPTITGANSKAVTLTDVTSNAQIFYTLDGNPPTNGAADTFGPVLSGQTIAFNLTSNTTLSAQATAQNFAPSGVSTAFFSPTNFSADQITFGFESGEASSQFITAPGQTYIAPVTLSLIPSAEIMYTLQFSLAISNLGSAPAVPVTGANAFTFSSMLEKPKPGSSPPVYEPIPPAMVAGGLLLTNNNSYDLLEVGWLERPPATNLYDTTAQTLITYSQDHDTMFLNTGGQVVVGGFSFQVPTTATLGEQYEIQIANPSGTSDGISTAVYIVAPTNGSMSNGPISSVKFVTVGSARYLVGDVAPFYWFNAGDFGDSYLQDNDVTETFQTAIYQYNGTNVATQHSDYFDAMDSSDGSDNNYYLGTDTAINNIEYGDGVLAVDDVYVTFRRSLDPTLYWFDRYDTATGKVAVQVSNLLTQPFIAGAATPATRTASTAQPTHAPRTTPSTKAVPADQVASSGPRYITVAADQVLSAATFPWLCQSGFWRPIPCPSPSRCSGSKSILWTVLRLSPMRSVSPPTPILATTSTLLQRRPTISAEPG